MTKVPQSHYTRNSTLCALLVNCDIAEFDVKFHSNVTGTLAV